MHNLTATRTTLKLNGKKIATIRGWWDSQMIFEDMIFVSDEAKKIWDEYYNSKKTVFSHISNTMIELNEGMVFYNLLHKC